MKNVGNKQKPSGLGLFVDTHCSLAVDPPEDLSVSDPGRLGYLDITWSPPRSLMNVTKCQIEYQLEYFNSFRNSWAVSVCCFSHF